MVGMMNKNLPAFLSNMLKEQGLPKEFIKDLIKKSCEASLVTDMHHCKWDSITRVLTTGDDLAGASKVKSFEGAAWIRMSLGWREKF